MPRTPGPRERPNNDGATRQQARDRLKPNHQAPSRRQREATGTPSHTLHNQVAKPLRHQPGARHSYDTQTQIMVHGSLPTALRPHLAGAFLGFLLSTLSTGAPKPAAALLLYQIRQSGPDVVVTGGNRGTFVNLSGLTVNGPDEENITEINGFTGNLGTGSGGPGTLTTPYTGISGPSSFGTIDITATGSPDGNPSDPVYLCLNIPVCGTNQLYLPTGYTGGTTTISSTTIFPNITLSALGLTPGSTFTWTWASLGDTPDVQLQKTFQIEIEPVPAPVPGLGATAAFAWSRRLRRRIKASGQNNESLTRG